MDETLHRVRGGATRQGREKRRRRTEAGVEARDEASRDRVGESWRGNGSSGSGFLGLGASERRPTSREDGREEGAVVVDRTGGTDREAEEVLESDRKAMSGTPPTRQLAGGCLLENVKVHPAREKDEGGAGKPNERLRRAVTH
mgnify:FL=1